MFVRAEEWSDRYIDIPRARTTKPERTDRDFRMFFVVGRVGFEPTKA